LIAPAIVLGILVEKEITGIFESLEKSSGGEAGLESALTKTLEKFDKWSGNRIDLSAFNLQAELTPWIKRISHPVFSMGKDTLSNVFVFITNTVVTFFTLFYLFRGDRSLRQHLVMILPLNSNQVERLVTGIDNSIIANVHGCVAVALAQGVLAGLAFLVLGVPDPILWGIVTGLFSMLPVIGSAAVWGPAAFLMFVNGSWWKGVALLIWGAVVIAQIDNFVRPYIIGKRSALHPLAVFISLMGGVAVFGVLGLFVGPVILSVTIVVFQMLKEGNLSMSNS
ncbi:MAG TPA: AI-2E family transporter, partial [Acidobacteriota bacterium]|nr:AI-2E family transporter [Acidobacteriota bacterium]